MSLRLGQSGRGRSQHTVSFLIAFVITWQATGPAWAWGRLGHRVVAEFADRHLNPTVRAEIAQILEPGESLADASTWADENRTRIHGSGPWHFADVPLDEDRYDDRLAGSGQIVPKLREFRTILADRTRPPAARRQALRFVVHLVGDLHQPLHVGEHQDRGGNTLQIHFYRRKTSLHHLWDDLILEHRTRGEDRWVAELSAIDDPISRSAAMDGTIEDWATGSLHAAQQAYQNPRTGRRIEPGEVLEDAYYESNLPIVRRQLYLAGTRLAWVLTDALRPE